MPLPSAKPSLFGGKYYSILVGRWGAAQSILGLLFFNNTFAHSDQIRIDLSLAIS